MSNRLILQEIIMEETNKIFEQSSSENSENADIVDKETLQKNKINYNIKSNILPIDKYNTRLSNNNNNNINYNNNNNKGRYRIDSKKKINNKLYSHSFDLGCSISHESNCNCKDKDENIDSTDIGSINQKKNSTRGTFKLFNEISKGSKLSVGMKQVRNTLGKLDM